MNSYDKTVFTGGFASGDNGAAKPAPFKRQYVATVYQGDVAFISPFKDVVNYDATNADKLPTGSICYVNASGLAVPGVGTATATNCPVPYLVYVGNDQKSVISQKGNATGGKVTLIPCTGYYRIVTTIFNTNDTTYAAGDFLTAAVTDGSTVTTVNNLIGVGVATNGATVYTDVVIGIVDGPVTNDHFDLPSLRFTCYFIPPMSASSN